MITRRLPSLRQQILNVLSDTEWSIGLDIARDAKINSFKLGVMYLELFALVREGLVESQPGPLSSDGVNRHRKYRKTRHCPDEATAAALREYHNRPDLDRLRAALHGAGMMLATVTAVVTLIWFLWV